MKSIRSSFIRFFCFGCLFLSLFPFEEAKKEFRIKQTNQDITVDGNLQDWQGVQGIPIHLGPEGKVMKPTQDLEVTAWFSYDPKRFYAAVKVKDDVFSFSQRGWRYGDGILLTFLEPSEDHTSDQFHTFGFSREGKENQKVLVNRNGEYFPSQKLNDLELKIIPNPKENILIYEMSLPWDYVEPLKPFFKNQWGINLIYVDRDKEKKRNIVQLYPDKNYDTEQTNQRKGALALFVHHIPDKPEFQSLLNGSHFYDDEPISLWTAVNSSHRISGWKLHYIMTSGERNIDVYKDIQIQKGMNRFDFRLPKNEYPTHDYIISLGAISPNGELEYNQTHSFYIVNRDDPEKWRECIAQFKKMEAYKKNTAFRNSIPSFEIRIQWINEYMSKAPPYADFRSLENWNQEIIFLKRKLEKGEPALFPKGNIGRLAHKSSLDNTLQPYSLYVPMSYKEESAIPLFVTLHGSGVDEQESLLYMSRVLNQYWSEGKTVPMIVMSPKARGLSDWYLGKSGKEVMKCIQHVQSLYHIDKKRIVLDGFSMGGYGAWRLGISHPQIFQAVIIRSGAIHPPAHLEGENVIDLLDKSVKIPFLIVHGDKDNAVSVEKVRKTVEKLEKLGIPHKYIEVKDGSHGGYDRWDDMIQWLNSVLDIRRRNILR